MRPPPRHGRLVVGLAGALALMGGAAVAQQGQGQGRERARAERTDAPRLGPPVGNRKTLTLGAHRWTTQNAGKPWSLRIAADRPATAVFEVRGGDHIGTAVYNNRSELLLPGNDPDRLIPYGRDFWAAGAIAVQGDVANASNVATVICQIHDTSDPDEYKSKSPPFALRFRGQDLYLTVHGDAAAISTRNSVQQRLAVVPAVARTRLNAAPLFHHWVVRLRFGRGHDGEVDFWWNGRRVYSGRKLLMGYNNRQGGYWKHGIYRPWKPGTYATDPAPETLRITHANVEIGPRSLIARVARPLSLR